MKVFEKLRHVGMTAALAQIQREPISTPELRIPLLRNIDSISGLIGLIIGALLLIGGVVAIIYLIFGGYQYITAGGDPERATKAKTTIINAIIGIIVVALAFVIFRVVINTLQVG